MKFKTLVAAILTAGSIFTACDDTTDTIGSSLITGGDFLKVYTDTFGVKTQSFISDAVLSRSTTGYLGKIKDPETGNYITGNFMAQFNTLDNYEFPAKDSLRSYIEEGKIYADSCEVRLFYRSFYGDSLATMNMQAYEMNKPMTEDVKYYSDFNPISEGLVRTTGDGIINENKTYTLADLSVDDDVRNNSAVYTPNIRIRLNKPYTKDGKTYKNYGTYIMNKYYEEGGKENFKNSYNFIHNVCPGMFFEMKEGLGSMAYISVCQLNVYFQYRKDSLLYGSSQFASTEEVLQTTTITNDNSKLEKLLEEDATFLKTPAGLFTEMELPVEDIIRNHENDTINSAKLEICRINNSNDSKYDLAIPKTVLLIPRDSLETFFSNNNITDNKKSYLATYSSQSNSYVFSNISGLVTYMSDLLKGSSAKRSNDWNKVVLVPVSLTTNNQGEILNITHDMSLSSTRLVKGNGDKKTSKVKVSVVYSKFSDE